MNEVEQTRRVSLRDVAQRAKVSIGTASNVFSGKASVAPETRALVLGIATEMGYVPRGIRQDAELMIGKTTTLGFIVRRTLIPLSSNPYYAPILNGAEKACAAHGISLMYSVVDEQIEHISEFPMMLQRREVQGLLIVDYFDSLFFTNLQQTGIPFVLIEYEFDALNTDSVTVDDERGGYLATRYLLQLGHTAPPPAIIGASPKLLSVARRLTGYFRALREEGIERADAYVRTGDLNVAGGYREMNALLDLPTPPTAVFCCNDLTAIGALNALKERSIKVPEQCSLIGYDDIDMASQLIPPLTTVKSETELLGMQGVWHLLERMNFPDVAPRHTFLRVKLVERRSVSRKSSSVDLAWERSSPFQ